MEREIIVQGSAEVRVPPDRAVVHVTVDADGGSRDEAYTAAARSAATVDGVLAAHEAEIDRTVTASLSVQPLTRWKRGESIRTGWRATRRTRIELTAFERLGELLAELAPTAILAGPEWRVDDANPAYADVRREAAADARRRAEAYASGLGVRLGPVAWISEPGLRQSGGDAPIGRAAPMAFAAAGGARSVPAEDEVIDISPEDNIIHARLEVAFGLDDDTAAAPEP
jgi:uncharacterized protein YggE